MESNKVMTVVQLPEVKSAIPNTYKMPICHTYLDARWLMPGSPAPQMHQTVPVCQKKLENLRLQMQSCRRGSLPTEIKAYLRKELIQLQVLAYFRPALEAGAKCKLLAICPEVLHLFGILDQIGIIRAHHLHAPRVRVVLMLTGGSKGFRQQEYLSAYSSERSVSVRVLNRVYESKTLSCTRKLDLPQLTFSASAQPDVGKTLSSLPGLLQ